MTAANVIANVRALPRPKARSTRVSRPDAGQMLAEMLEMLAQILGQMLEPLRCWLRYLRFSSSHG